MKKYWVAATVALISIGAHAENWCGYKDYFRLSDESHPGIYITNGEGDTDILLQILGPRSFIIRDNVQCKSGFAHVIVAYDADNWCNLDIKDGPWAMHPVVNASCQGIKYMGTRYDGLGTNSYTIDLD